MNILLTGATGFVGQHLLAKVDKAHDIILIGRRKLSSFNGQFIYCDVADENSFLKGLEGIDVVIHCAARVHVMKDDVTNPLDEYRAVNTRGTVHLARQAANAGVKRFIFVSSIKVNGEFTLSDIPFTAQDEQSPQDDYGLSKAEAEQELFALSSETGIEIVVIRPTLVYGPGVKANFDSFINLVSKGIPLPFGCITNNKRSLVSVDNLVDVILTCIEHPKAANQVFLVSDDYDVSTSEMANELAKALGKPMLQLPIPVWCYRLAGKLFKKSEIVERLVGSLQVDISHTKKTLGWTPPQSLQDGFKQVAESFLKSKKRRK